MAEEVEAITTDANGAPIEIGTPVVVDGGAAATEKSGIVKEVMFKGQTRDDIFVKVSGVRGVVELGRVTAMSLTELEYVVYRLFSSHGVNLSVSQLADCMSELAGAMPDGG